MADNQSRAACTTPYTAPVSKLLALTARLAGLPQDLLGALWEAIDALPSVCSPLALPRAQSQRAVGSCVRSTASRLDKDSHRT